MTIPGLNIGAHKEAAEHFLSALSMQEQSAGETSDQLWFTLRRALMSMASAVSRPVISSDLLIFT